MLKNDLIADPVSHDSKLVVVFDGEINDFIDLCLGAHDTHGNHPLGERLTFMDPAVSIQQEGWI